MPTSETNNEISSLSELVQGLNIEIKKHHLSAQDIEEFIEYVKSEKEKDPEVQISLVEYVTDKFYAGKSNLVVVPDLTGEVIGTKIEYPEVDSMTTQDIDRMRENHTDLSGIDFTGSSMKGVIFNSCILDKSTFCDTDLTDVTFYDCYMPDVDMRGADISGCKMEEPDIGGIATSMTPEEYSELQVYNNKSRYEGIQFSSLEPLFYQYAEKNKEIELEAEDRFTHDKQEKLERKQKELERKKVEVDKKLKSLGWVEWSLGSNTDYNSLVSEQRSLEQEIRDIETSTFESSFDKSQLRYVVHPSIASLPSIVDDTNIVRFDPAYERGSSKEEREQEKQYVRLTREDAEQYIEALKENPGLSINAFAENQLVSKGIEGIKGARIIADFSTYIEASADASYSGLATDLSGLDFSGANLQGACFAGADLRGCKFNGANISSATFEGANLEGAEFLETIAKDVNLFAANMRSAMIGNSTFSRAYMRQSEATEANINQSKFNFADIRDGKWDEASINQSEFYHADLQGISLINADIKKTKMQHANLNKAIINSINIVESDLTNAFMRNVEARNTTIQNSILESVDAKGINLTESEIDELSSLEGIDLENAIMRKVKADRVSFINANMEGIDASEASMQEAILEDVNLKFSNLEKAIMKGVKASRVDMTGANVTDINARRGEFKNAILKHINGSRANFSDAIMEASNLRGAKVQQAIFERVNLKKADLRNAKIEDIDLKEAQMEGAKVNDGTDIHAANIQGATGKLEYQDIERNKKKVSIAEKNQHDQQVNEAKSKNTITTFLGNVLQGGGNLLNYSGSSIRRPVSKPLGMAIGAIVGALIVGGIAATVIATGGMSLPLMAAVIGGAIAVGAAGGTAAGYFGVKHLGLSTTATAGLGFAAAGINGAIVALGAAVGVNHVIKQAFGQSIDELIGKGLETFGTKNADLGEEIGLTEEQQKGLYDQQRSDQEYNMGAPKRQKPKDISKAQGEQEELGGIRRNIINKAMKGGFELTDLEEKVRINKQNAKAKTTNFQNLVMSAGTAIKNALIGKSLEDNKPSRAERVRQTKSKNPDRSRQA